MNVPLRDRLEADVPIMRFASDPGLMVGGRLKASPEDFQVTEVMPYGPMGEGEHVYVTVRRSGFTTQQVGKCLSKCLKVPMRDVGWGGMKDKVAVATQTFSLRMGVHCDLSEVRQRLADETPFTILAVDRHRNKIKRGHVAYNQFVITLRECRGSLTDAIRIRDAIMAAGVPNYYGIQRFGNGYSNLAAATAQLAKTCRSRKDVFMISVLQSALFNVWLTQRIDGDRFDQVILGDVAKKVDSGGLFVVDDLDTDSARYESGEITYTGPMFGYDMMRAEANAREFEDALLRRYELNLEAFREHNAPGTRRPAQLRLDSLAVVDCGNGSLQFEFTLPTGAYATTVMREFTKEN